MKIGFIGLGIMGAPMALHLVNAGHDVTYVQNVTDVADPLLERAPKVKVDWVELAERETELFRQDMTALRVLPPAVEPPAMQPAAHDPGRPIAPEPVPE